jgi:hypothetical protein
MRRYERREQRQPVNAVNVMNGGTVCKREQADPENPHGIPAVHGVHDIHSFIHSYCSQKREGGE